MKKIIAIILSLVMILSFTACGTKAEAGWKEQYDLGIKYVNEAKYEEAILAFTKALEIDPKQQSAYIALADAYIRQGDYTAAQEILTKAETETGTSTELTQAKEKLEEEIALQLRTERYDGDDGSYTIATYDENDNEIRYETYNANGVLQEKGIFEYEYEYYNNGEVKKEFRYEYLCFLLDDYDEVRLSIQTYNEDGEFWKWRNFPLYVGKIIEYTNDDADATVPFDIKVLIDGGEHFLCKYDESSNGIRKENYSANGTFEGYQVYICDENNDATIKDYNADGTLI